MRVALCLCLLGAAVSVQAAENWLMQIDRWGNPSYMTLHLQDEDGKLSGTLDGDTLTGTRGNGKLVLNVIDQQGKRYEYKGSASTDRLQGTADFPDTNNATARASHTFSARRLPERASDAPQRHAYIPKDYSNTFSATRLPVLTVWPGDTIHTTTIDSGGVDEHGVTRALYGNPQTGPFFVMGAEAGDTLVVHLLKLKLNRDYADSLDAIVSRAKTTAMASRAANLGKPVRWKLDRERGLARPEHRSDALRDLAVPMRPMLGGLAVAPPDGPAVSTGDTGRFGGNMDFNEVIEGNLVYLPVQQPGALLYLGDAHALQDYGLSLADSAVLLGSSVQYTIANLAGRSVGVAAKIRKDLLPRR